MENQSQKQRQKATPLDIMRVLESNMMNDTKNTKHFQIRGIPAELHTLWKLTATTCELSMEEFAVEAIKHYIKYSIQKRSEETKDLLMKPVQQTNEDKEKEVVNVGDKEKV